MNPLEIEAFLAITETRNLSKAADKLFVSQSTISSRLTNLESEIGSPLVNRRPGIKGVTLTPKGNEFLTWPAVIWRWKKILNLEGELVLL